MTTHTHATAPTTTRLVELPDGRTMAVDEHGDAAGPPVVFLHSAPGSRRLDPDPATTTAAGIRLITVDRPGYGQSSPVPAGSAPTVASLSDDIAAALRAVGVEQALVVGWSAGGRYAMALAERHPDLVRSIALVGTPAPDDAVPWLADEHRQLSAMLRENPEAAVATVAQIFGAEGAPSGDDAIAMIAAGSADAAVAVGEARGRLVEMLDEAFVGGAVGVATDIVADQVTPWGIDPSAVTVPATLWYGEADDLIAPAHGAHWASVLGQARLRTVAGAGHLLALTAWADILAAD
ncbi:MAG: alpha/beta fold hydrolase [Acidimicrobiales bacterium]